MKKTLFITAILLCTVCMAYGQWTYTNLSEPKEYMGSAALGFKAYFAGGGNGSNSLTTVEVYDVTTGTWGFLDNLSVAREVISGVAGGSKVFFAGGMDWSTSFATVDIYDTLTLQHTTAQLSVDRFSITSVSDGNTVMFAGGVRFPSIARMATVDKYDIGTGQWTTASLSQAREGIAGAVVGNLAIFAGGITNSGTTNIVDKYNFSTGLWLTDTLSQARGYAAATTLGNKVIIAGGVTSFGNPTNRVDIYDATTNTWSIDSLSEARSWMGPAVTVNGKAYFAGGGVFVGNGFINPSDVIDIYNGDKWSTDILFNQRLDHSVLNVGDNLVVAGGKDETNYLSTLEILYVPYVPHIINVPNDFPTIQAGIDAANPGDTVLVADGLYYENINFLGKKPLLVASEFILNGDTNHINNTIIDGSQSTNPDMGSVVTFESEEDTTSVLCGFTITGGSGTLIPGFARMGGGVLISSAGCKLQNNYIEYNEMTSDLYTLGGGICAGGPADTLPWVVLRNNRINYNKAISLNDQGSGGGMEIYYPLIMVNNQISYNEAKGINFAIGGGARLLSNFGPVELNVRNNLFTHNKAESTGLNTILVISGGITINGDVSGYFSNNTVSQNINITEGLSYGPGLCVDEAFAGNLYIENNFLINNSFTGGTCIGGGLSIYNSKGFFNNNVVMGNTATNGGGIAIEENLTNKAILINNTVSGNDATFGSGLWASSAKAVVVNTIIYNNTPTGSNAIFEENSDLEVHYSDIEGDEVWPGEGNLNCTPTFLTDGYHLDAACQLVNSGITSIEINGMWYACPAYDIDGDVRPYASTQPEIGVDEVDFATVIRPVSAGRSFMQVFPNPADQYVSISVMNDGAIEEVTLFNLSGQRVYSRSPQNNILDVSGLEPGVYVVEVISNQQKYREKLVIE